MPRSIPRLRRRKLKPNTSSPAKLIPPPPRKKSFSGLVDLADAAVVFTESVVVAAVAPLIVTEAVALEAPVPRAQVAASVGLAAVVVTVQVRLTAPVNP